MNGENFKIWHDAMMEQMESIATNKFWNLIQLPSGHSTISCKWIYKTRRNVTANIEWYKVRLVAKGFTKREGIYYQETFSPILKKDLFRIIMALVAHFDLELYQMDVKTAFFSEDPYEEVYMK